MTTEEPWFPDDDVLPRPPSVLVGTARACARLGAALLAVGALGVVLWLWIVLRQQGLLGGVGLDSLFGDRLGTTGNRLDVFATTFTFLTGAALTGGLGMALRLAGAYVIAEKGGPPARSTAGGRTPADDDGPPTTTTTRTMTTAARDRLGRVADPLRQPLTELGAPDTLSLVDSSDYDTVGWWPRIRTRRRSCRCPRRSSTSSSP